MADRYRHYKGNVYRVLGIAHTTKDASAQHDPMVIYTRDDESTETFWWAREYREFHGQVEKNGKMVQRFEKLDGGGK